MADDSIADMTKVCTKCGVAKPANGVHFHKAKSGPFGLAWACKACMKLKRDAKPRDAETNSRRAAYKRERYKDSERVRQQIKDYATNNKEKRLAARRTSYAAGTSSAKRYADEYRAANREKIRADKRSWYLAHQDSEKAKSRAGYHSDMPRQQALMKAWREANPDYHKKYSLDRYYQDIEAGRARCRAHRAADPAKHRERFKVWCANNPDKMRDTARLRRARKAGTSVEKIAERDVFDRDEWKCYICGTPVTNDRPFGAPDKAVQEHVIPLSRGGTHTIDNVRCACHRCNQMKGASLTPEQVRMRLQAG